MKRVKLKILLVFATLVATTVNHASIEGARSTFYGTKGSARQFVDVAKELVDAKLYYTAIPLLKEYLVTTKSSSKKLDRLLDDVISVVGVKQFEVLPSKVLKKSKAPTVNYILAKKYFRLAKYKKALKQLGKKIPMDHPTKPFSLFLEGSIYSILGDHKKAGQKYEVCVDVSNDQMGDVDEKNRIRQLRINRDYCIVGIPRSEFATKKFTSANFHYLDLPKSSPIWPEILFEEAWTSFYQGDFNRTLGKLVTYKAPVFNHIFNPEIEVLTALTYLELCLWNDVKKEVDKFYSKYQSQVGQVRKFMKKHGKDYKFYYQLAKLHEENGRDKKGLLAVMLNSIIRDGSYVELKDSFDYGKVELDRVKAMSRDKFNLFLGRNLKESMFLQRDLLGAYIRKRIMIYVFQLERAFENMSYLKLEVLSRKKSRLYSKAESSGRSRGDIQYLQRNDKQYFWTFNGEFWADELGDYVFALKSECN